MIARFLGPWRGGPWRGALALGAVAAVVLLAGCAPARVAPPPAAATSNGLPAPTREVLPNGLRLIIQDHRASDITAIYLWVGVGVRDEAPSELGASHFQEHMLFKGTDRWGPGYVDRVVEGAGGRSNAVTSYDYTTFYVLMPKDRMETGVQLLSEMAFRSTFDPKEIEREREVIFEEARIEQDNPRSAIVRQLYGMVFAGQPYGRPVLGTRETMLAATHDSLLKYARYYYVPENMALVVAGPNDPAAVRAAALKHFGRAKATGFKRAPVPPPPPLTGRVSRDVERPEQQAALGLAWPAPRADDPEGFAVDLLCAILGGTESSRLAIRLRDKERLVSGVKMSYSALVGGGIVTIRAELEPQDLARAEAVVIEEIARLQADGVSEEERQLAIVKAESEHAFDTETSEGLANALGLAETTWALEEELRYLERLRAVTREQIQAAARRYLSREAFARLAFLPGKASR